MFIDRPTDVKKSARRSKRLLTAALDVNVIRIGHIALLNDIQYGAYTRGKDGHGDEVTRISPVSYLICVFLLL